MGDETYTTLKSTDPFVKELVKVIGSSVPKVRIYFPDEGSAALCRRDWDFTVRGITNSVIMTMRQENGIPRANK